MKTAGYMTSFDLVRAMKAFGIKGIIREAGKGHKSLHQDPHTIPVQ